jgi:HlyD family secretion protein
MYQIWNSDCSIEAPGGYVDRPLDPVYQRTRRLGRAGKIAGLIACIVALIIWLPGWIRPSVSRARVRTAKVTLGPIESTITASGTVVPEVERALSSPLDARVLRILKRPGDPLTAGDPLVVLDASESVLSVEKLSKDLALKDNQQAQTRLALEKSLLDIEGRLNTKRLDLDSLRADLDDSRTLFKQGLISREKLRQAELAEAKAVIELKQIEGERNNVQQANTAQSQGLSLERDSLGKEVAEARRQLDLATTRADRDGVVTWALSEEGVLVRRGDVIARIADLRSFRVDATVPDVHAKTLAVGMPVIVRLNDDDALEGRVSAIHPKIENGVMTFTVSLADKSNHLLRSNQRVDVLVVLQRKARALRLKKGPFAEGDGYRQAFVVRGDRAVRTPIGLGIASFDEFEVVNGLADGDEVIISDMRDYLHLREISIKQ